MVWWDFQINPSASHNRTNKETSCKSFSTWWLGKFQVLPYVFMFEALLVLSQYLILLYIHGLFAQHTLWHDVACAERIYPWIINMDHLFVQVFFIYNFIINHNTSELRSQAALCRMWCLCGCWRRAPDGSFCYSADYNQAFWICICNECVY